MHFTPITDISFCHFQLMTSKSYQMMLLLQEELFKRDKCCNLREDFNNTNITTSTDEVLDERRVSRRHMAVN